jgi:site-specific recombinase XerD
MSTPAIRAHLDWMRLRNLARSTIETRRGILEILARATNPLKANHTQIEQTITARGLRPSTRNLWIAHLGGFYRWALDEELIDKNPMRRVPRAEAPAGLPRPVPEDSLVRAFAAADKRMTAWLSLGAYAGLRCAEMSALTGENVSYDMRTLRVDFSKRGKSRVIPMHPKVADALRPWHRPGRLWKHGPKVVSIYVNRHFERLDEPYTAHQLRHRFACQVYEACGDLNIVRELLGHSSTATTQVYAAISARRTSAAVAMIA